MMQPEYTTQTFSDIYSDVEIFLDDYMYIGLPVLLQPESVRTIYFLLMAKYKNSPIANRDPEQFKLKLFSTIYQYGPTWEKRQNIQAELRDLSMDELMTGAVNIYNTALNPAQEPTTATSEEMPFINQQNVNKYKRSKLDAYGVLWSLLRTDVTESFIKEFNKLFKIVVAPEQPLLYEDDCED